MKKKWTNLVMMECLAQKIKKYKSVKLKFIWHEKTRRRDPDNIAFAKKFILDGMVESRVLENDGWKQVKGFSDDWVVDKNWQGVVVEIEEVE